LTDTRQDKHGHFILSLKFIKIKIKIYEQEKNKINLQAVYRLLAGFDHQCLVAHVRLLTADMFYLSYDGKYQ